MSVRVITSPMMVENVTHTIFTGFGAVGGSVLTGLDGGGSQGHRPSLGKHCVDLHQRLIPHGVHFVPGPDECTLCACDDGEPKWCKAVLCSPPTDCKSFRVGNSCCDFICLDDSLNNNGPNTGGPYLSGPMEIANFVPKVVIAAVTAMLSLSLLFFLIHRLRQRHIQGRLNSARAHHSTQMCDECDDTRSLDFSNDFFEHRNNSPMFPPSYMAWWKPPSSYFPPRGEAPPPYDEAIMATTCLGGAPPYNNNNVQNSTNNNNPGGGGIVTDIPIIVPPPVLPPGPVFLSQNHPQSCSPAIQRLANAIANTANSGGNTIAASSSTAVVTASSPALSSTSTTSVTRHAKGKYKSVQKNDCTEVANSTGDNDNSSVKTLASSSASASPAAALRNKPSSSSGSDQRKQHKSERKSKSSKVSKSRRRSSSEEPQPGPSSRASYHGASITGREDDEDDFRIAPPTHGPAPPTYEDAIYSLHHHPLHPIHSQSGSSGRDFYRHSLTLPPRRFLDGGCQLYPRVVVRNGGAVGGCSGGPLTTIGYAANGSNGEERACNVSSRDHHNQRYSLQFHIGGAAGATAEEDVNGGGDWSSSSSTLSLSTTPNSPVGRPPSLSSSSDSSVSESTGGAATTLPNNSLSRA